MYRTLSQVVLTLLALVVLFSNVDSDVKIPESKSQLYSPIEWIAVPGTDDQFYMAQRTSDSHLLLTPNESFFPKLGLRAIGKGSVPDIDLNLNKGSSFESITQWDLGDRAEWGLWFEKSGEISLRIGITQQKGESQFKLRLGEVETSVTVNPSKKEGPIAVGPLNVSAPGRHSLILTCQNKTPDAKPQLHWIEVSGPATTQAAVLRKRWRPAAAHTRFTSSQNPQDVRIWIMEMDAKPGNLGFYSPITTPFGYFGPSWLASGEVNTKLNFSLWSYGRNKPEPPLEQLSHLIAIGNPDASFDGFGHEGTGVKIRDWDPLTNRQRQRQALALRVIPGDPYDTYISYFYAHDENRWQLFGVGKKYNDHKPLQSLWVGSFVEVPGRSSVQRTGPYERQMRYRGWVVDKAGKIYALDQMRIRNIDKSTGLTHTDRGITRDNRFYLQTGGWVFRKGSLEQNVSLPYTQSQPKVDYLDSEDLAYLQQLPSEINSTDIQRRAEGIVVTFDIVNLGRDSQVKIFWGDEEALTFADRWQNQMVVSNPEEGANTAVLKDVPSNSPIFVRLFLKNHEGQFWSTHTAKSATP